MPSLSTFEGPERRTRTRFPIELAARYAVSGRQEIESTGRTVNISSQGVLTTSAHEVSPDTSITVVIEWPILLGRCIPHMRPSVGEKLGRYEIFAPMIPGGIGMSRSNRYVAIKVSNAQFTERRKGSFYHEHTANC